MEAMQGQRSAGISDETLACVFKYIESAEERATVSLVCRQWRRVDGNTRKYVTIANIYAIAPSALSRRFKTLEGIKLKGKPRAVEWDLLPEDWGGYAGPWVRELGRAYTGLQTLQLRRMEVGDADLQLLAMSPCSAALQVLHLHKCYGFSTRGLVPIARSCRSLRVLNLEESVVADDGGQWLHELAQYNSVLEVLNFAVLGMKDIDMADLALLVERCKSLVSLKVSDIDVVEVSNVLSKSTSLLELGGGCCSSLGDHKGTPVCPDLPKRVVSLSGLWAMTDVGLPMVLPLRENLKKLDLKFTLLSGEGHCELLGHCFALEELQVRNVLGDKGMEVLARTCTRLKRLRVDYDETGFISQRGVIAVSQGCGQLRHLTLYVRNITNAALAMVGQGCVNLTDCRFVLEAALEPVSDLPLDDGVKLLMRGCVNLTRFALYLRHGALTDTGLAHIGTYGGKLKWLLIGCAGESDVGLSNLAKGCQQLERLEVRDCPFGEAGLALAIVKMRALKYLWMQGYRATDAGGHLLALSRPCLNIEILSASMEEPVQLLAYYSLAGPRTDGPPEVKVLVSNADKRSQDMLTFSIKC